MRPDDRPRRALLLSRPPCVPDWALRVLRALWPDLPAHEWAALLGLPLDEVERAIAWIQRDEQREAA